MSWKSYHTKDLTERYLFRFLSLNYLEDFLNTGSIWFSRADKFGDKMECVRIAELKKSKPDFEQIEIRKQKFLINCWHLASKESLALWDTYSDTVEKRRKVAIRFKRQDLIQIIQDTKFKNDSLYYQTKWIHGKVQYRNLVNVKPEKLTTSALKYPSFRKEKAFEYENEYRFIIELIQPTTKLGLAYELGKIEQLPFEILINPLLNKEEYSQVKEIIISRGFESNLRDSVLARWLKPELW